MKYTPLLFITILFLASCSANKNVTQQKNTKKENFHLYLLMGQSNMAGRGKVASIDTLIHPRVFMLTKEMNWVPAKDPVHFDKNVAGTGLGLTFGKIMANENPGVRIGLIPCAKGGSSINQWFRDSLHRQTKSYPYNEMIDRAKRAMADGMIKGILWHQGESDTRNTRRVESYEQQFYAMLDSLKSDLQIESIPVVIGELGYFIVERKAIADTFNQVLKHIAQGNKHIAMVSADQLDHKGDTTHFNSDAYHALGARYANEMIKLQKLMKE